MINYSKQVFSERGIWLREMWKYRNVEMWRCGDVEVFNLEFEIGLVVLAIVAS